MTKHYFQDSEDGGPPTDNPTYAAAGSERSIGVNALRDIVALCRDYRIAQATIQRIERIASHALERVGEPLPHDDHEVDHDEAGVPAQPFAGSTISRGDG